MSWTWLSAGLSGGLFIGMLICLEIGFRAGRRRAAKEPEYERPGADAILGAIWGLMGLILAFSFAWATSRLDERRQIIVEEANAIGTAYLRLDLLPASYQPELRESFRRYLDTRLSAYEKLPDLRAAEQELAKAATMQSQIWARAEEACRAQGTQLITILVLPAINDMIDITTARTIAGRTHSPPILYVLFAVLSLLSSLMAGHAMSASKRRPLFHMIGFSAAVAMTVYVIVDLEFPRLGLIRLKAADRALIELRETMK